MLASSTITPCWVTARGSRASTRLIRFCTATVAFDGSEPGANEAMIWAWPEVSLVDSKYISPGMPFSSSSTIRVTPS